MDGLIIGGLTFVVFTGWLARCVRKSLKSNSRTKKFALLSIQLGGWLWVIALSTGMVASSWGNEKHLTPNGQVTYNISLQQQTWLIITTLIATGLGFLLLAIGWIVLKWWAVRRGEHREQLKETDGIPVEMRL